MADHDQQYKVNHALAIIPDPESSENLFAVENLERKEAYPITDARMVEMLDLARDWTPGEELVAAIADGFPVSEPEAAELFAEFVDREFLVPADRDPPTSVAEGESWLNYGWEEAFEYYLYIRNYPYIDYSEGKEAFERDFGRMREYSEQEDIPPNYKTYDDAEQLALPEVERDDPLVAIGDALSFTTKPTVSDGVDRDLLSTLLFYTFGQTGTVRFPYQGEFLLKTSPSGGARHPTEAYVAALDVEGVPEGLYHYSVKDHALDVLERGTVEDRLREAIYELDIHPAFDVSFVIVCSSVVERSMWRYREPRSYAVVHNDVGHLLETLRLACNAHGLETTFGHGFDDSALSELLGLNRFHEPLFKYAPVGVPRES